MKATLLCQHPIERKWQFAFNVLHGAEPAFGENFVRVGMRRSSLGWLRLDPLPPCLLLGLLHCCVHLLRRSVLRHVYMMRHCIASGIGHESGALVLKWDK